MKKLGGFEIKAYLCKSSMNTLKQQLMDNSRDENKNNENGGVKKI